MDTHPLAQALPMLGEEDYGRLRESIRTHGQIESIVLMGEMVVDGRNRLKACRELGLSPATVQYRGSVPVEDYIWAKNVARRHMTDDQKAAAVMRWEEYEKRQAKERKKLSQGRGQKGPVISPDVKGGDARDKLAERAGVAQNKIRQAMLVKKHDEKLLEQVERGEVTLAGAVKRVPPPVPRGKRVSTEQRESQIRALRAEGMDSTQIADRIGLSRGRVSHIAHAAGIELRGKPAIQRLDELRDLAAQGYRSEQIAERMGTNPGYIRKLANENDIALPDAKLKSRSLDVNRIVSETVMAADALTSGLDLVDSRIDDIDGEMLPQWIDVLDEALRILSGLRKTLRRRKRDLEKQQR